ncbi:MAG: ABC transporter ATP-binding protein [Phycisphaeraceae bacterium]|jgi:branched-chain amino acid transport system ATP-binding protein|nr:ABC transporter ATP-binding protein [Phycisphaeraceae bacterium]
MSDQPPVILSVRDVSVRYGAIRAINNVSFDVRQGQILTLIGANGAGKTTTLRAISGMVRASGQVRFKDQPITGVRPDLLVRRGLCHCPEGRGIFANMTVQENLDLGAFTRTDADEVEKDKARVFELFPRIKERLKQNAGTLSGGEQQMLAIGRALLARPVLLLMDEPSLGLAPQLVQTIFRIIREINQAGVSILLVEQNAHMALRVAHHAVVLETGSVRMSGPAADLAASDEVRKAYLGHG